MDLTLYDLPPLTCFSRHQCLALAEPEGKQDEKCMLQTSHPCDTREHVE